MMEMNNLIDMKINGDGSNLLTSQERSAFLATMITTSESYIKTGVKVEQDAKTKNDLSSVLYKIRNEIKDPLRRLQTIHMIYGERNVVAFKELESGQILSKTDAFHLYNVKGIFEGKAVTLRMINPHLSVYYMKEIENIRAMDHVNFATHVAMVSTLPEFMETSHSNDDWLRLLTEPCVGDLETYVLSHRNEIGSVAGESAKETFIHIAYGISNGLEYIHSKGFVHGQLQLSAVLLCTHMVPKLCDLNVLPYYKDRSYEECIYHTAPEVINDGTYGPEADVYSYGILLWELWYGRHTKRCEDLNELDVCSGGRPILEDKRPPQHLEELITMCWDGQVNRRPTADVRVNRLKPNQII
ncbi:hypothetical protein ACJMK2_036965 [Sinanodonta woodiana]|uniref:Protein kinase domain-containing protein n=1 Tax=Sinanodonta woodiana TaxID=1069815 RepID=A0ABD3WK33_SINWO